jgi:hypothetical protein
MPSTKQRLVAMSDLPGVHMVLMECLQECVSETVDPYFRHHGDTCTHFGRHYGLEPTQYERSPEQTNAGFRTDLVCPLPPTSDRRSVSMDSFA